MSIETRTYADADRARAAIDELSAKGFSDVKALFKPDHVRVVVNARFGEGRNASEILDRHGPLTSGEAANDDSDPSPSRSAAGILSKVQDPATPLSNILGLPVLSKGLSRLAPKSLIYDPAPLSNWLNWPTLYGATGGARKGSVASPADSPAKDGPSSSGTPVGQRPDSASKEGEASSGTPAEERRHDSPSSDAEAVSGTMGDVRQSRERRRPPTPS